MKHMKPTFTVEQYIKDRKQLPLFLEMKVHDIEELPPVHQHDFYELVYVVHGQGIHQYEDKPYRLSAGDILLIRPGASHTYSVEAAQRMEIINCLLLPELLDEAWVQHADPDRKIASLLRHTQLNRLEPGHPRLSLGKEDGRRVEALLLHMLEEQQQARAGMGLVLSMQLVVLLQLIARYYEEEQQRDKQASSYEVSGRITMVRRVRQYLERCFEQKLDMDRISRGYGISPRHMNRIFKEDTGMTLTEMVQHLRIERAKHLLVHTKDRIIDISGKVGYEDPSFFSKLFERKIGCSPGKFREERR